jgi:hypothetical protein
MNAIRMNKNKKTGRSAEPVHQGTMDGSPHVRGMSPTLNGPLSSFYSTGPVLSLKPLMQAKLTIGQPNDKYEQEADRVADQVMRMPKPEGSLVNGHLSLGKRGEKNSLVQHQSTCPECPEKEEIQNKLLTGKITPLVQRQVEEEEEEETPIQAKSLSGKPSQVTPGLQSQIQSLRGGGQPLPKSVRNFFEPRFGMDFSQVRLHTDSKATETAKSINAKAFTSGKDVVFNAGQYSPNTHTGKSLIAHELTHIVQQGMNSQKVDYRKDQSNSIQRTPRWAGLVPTVPPIGKISPIEHAVQSVLSTTPMIQAKLHTTYMWQVYNLAGKRGKDVTDAEIKTTIEYQHYVKYWKHVGMTELLALFACRRIIDRFLRGIRGRKANYVASGWDAIRVKTNIPHGVVNVKNYTSLGNLESKGGTLIELEWIPNKGGKYSAPGSVNWFQTVSTNQSTDMLNPPPPDLNPIKFVDGDPNKQGKQEIQTPRFYYSAAKNDYNDIPTRWSNSKGTVYFYAETSAVGIKGGILERLATYSWGFKLYRSGRSGQQMRIESVSRPSTYHLSKLAELQALQKVPNP